MEVIVYKKHRGLMNTEDQSVIFYGVGFTTIIDAIKLLKHFEPAENTYTGWYYNGHKGFHNRETDEVFIDLRWIPSEKFAKDYIDLKKS